MYLNGEFGSHPSDVNPYAASTFTRWTAMPHGKGVGDYYRGGGLVLSDRYTTSNAVHQASKLPEAEWEGFFRWLFDFECGKLGLPPPIWWSIWTCPRSRRCASLRSREASTHTKGDIHEVDTGYLALCRKTALRAADCLGWVKIPCVDGAGALRSMEDIHRDIWAAAARILG